MVDEHLRLVDEAAKRRRVDDAVAVALELGAQRGRRLGDGGGRASVAAVRGVGRELVSALRVTCELLGQHARAARRPRARASRRRRRCARIKISLSPARSAFLSTRMCSSSSSTSTPRRRGRQPGALRAGASMRSQSRCGEPAERGRRARREHHAEADGFAVQPALVAADGLDRVAERVAEVQQRAPAVLALVLGDDRGLDLAAAPDRVRQRGRRRARAARRCAPRASRRTPRRR